jgi:pimeloyl-ACP methyl ester carboxylesterase
MRLIGGASMLRPMTAQARAQTRISHSQRQRLLADLPVVERRIDLAGVSTAVLEGGSGSPVVLLHGPAANATHWVRVIPGLVARHRVVAPDLPGHGASTVSGGALDLDRMMTWLGELISATCTRPPVLVGHVTGGALAARFASAHGDRVRGLILVDTLGLAPFEPPAEMGLAVSRFLAEPNPRTHRELWQFCAHDLDRVRREMGALWEPFEAYNVDRAGSDELQAAFPVLMGALAMEAIPEEVLARIAVPTTLVWGREDLANPLAIAEAASARLGWPLRVIDRCADDPPIEDPQALLRELDASLEVAR